MSSMRGPLLIVAAALFWMGASQFYSLPGYFNEYSGNAGFIVAGALLLWGVIETVRAR
jgi:hypothetical protein